MTLTYLYLTKNNPDDPDTFVDIEEQLSLELRDSPLDEDDPEAALKTYYALAFR